MSAASTSGNGSGDRPAGDSGDRPAGDSTGPTDRARSGRGVAIVIVAVVIGVLLLPSATRPPLAVDATTVGTSVTVPPPSATTTTQVHGHRTSPAATTTVAPSTVHVLVANATTTNGVAGAVTSFLASKGFGTLTATNALVKVTASQIYTVGGAVADVSSVAAALGLPASSIEPAASAAPVSSTTGANVVVITGPDLASRFKPASG